MGENGEKREGAEKFAKAGSGKVSVASDVGGVRGLRESEVGASVLHGTGLDLAAYAG